MFALESPSKAVTFLWKAYESFQSLERTNILLLVVTTRVTFHMNWKSFKGIGLKQLLRKWVDWSRYLRKERQSHTGAGGGAKNCWLLTYFGEMVLLETSDIQILIVLVIDKGGHSTFLKTPLLTHSSERTDVMQHF